jgi:hypothetical protein
VGSGTAYDFKLFSEVEGNGLWNSVYFFILFSEVGGNGLWDTTYVFNYFLKWEVE